MFEHYFDNEEVEIKKENLNLKTKILFKDPQSQNNENKNFISDIHWHPEGP